MSDSQAPFTVIAQALLEKARLFINPRWNYISNNVFQSALYTGLRFSELLTGLLSRSPADLGRMRSCDATDNPAELVVSEEMKEPKLLQWFFNVLGIAFHQAGIYFTVQQLHQKLFMWKQLRCVLRFNFSPLWFLYFSMIGLWVSIKHVFFFFFLKKRIHLCVIATRQRIKRVTSEPSRNPSTFNRFWLGQGWRLAVAMVTRQHKIGLETVSKGSLQWPAKLGENK